MCVRASECVCVLECVCVWVSVCACEWVCVRASECVSEWVSVCACEWMCVWVNVCACEWVSGCVWERGFIYVFIFHLPIPFINFFYYIITFLFRIWQDISRNERHRTKKISSTNKNGWIRQKAEYIFFCNYCLYNGTGYVPGEIFFINVQYRWEINNFDVMRSTPLLFHTLPSSLLTLSYLKFICTN